jgi:hypothetical protein
MITATAKSLVNLVLQECAQKMAEQKLVCRGALRQTMSLDVSANAI